MTKICRKCERELPIEEFHADPSKKDGKKWACRDCVRSYNKTYNEENRDRNNERGRKYYSDNTEACLRRVQIYQIENRQEIIKHQHARHGGNPSLMMWHKAKERASKKGLPFSIKKEDIVIPEVCPILGVTLAVGSIKDRHNSPSLDRIDPMLGYTPDNVAVISHRANTIKNNGTAEEHKKIANWIDFMLSYRKLKEEV
jgi:hypothetical protein